MKTIFLLTILLLSSRVFAGFGGMGNVADDDGYVSGSTMSIIFWCGVIGAASGVVYAKHKNRTHKEQIATDGCAIVGGLIGVFILPFVYLLLIN